MQLTTPCAREAGTQLPAVVGLFRVWLFRVGAQDLGATEAWQELQAAASSREERAGLPPREFALDGAEFKYPAFARALYGAAFENPTHLAHRSAVGCFWWRLAWDRSCAELERRFDSERRLLPRHQVGVAELRAEFAKPELTVADSNRGLHQAVEL